MQMFYLWDRHHSVLLEKFFLPTFKEHNEGDFDLVGVKLSEPDGCVKFGNRLFRKMTTEKAEAICRLCDQNKDAFLVSDCDIQFFGSILGEVSRA